MFEVRRKCWDDGPVTPAETSGVVAVSTADRLRAAAEALLLEKGHEATSLRDITERAGANVAAVSYHFGSKDALLARVYGEVLTEAAAMQRSRLEALPEAASLEELVRAWLAPALDPETTERETRVWALIHRGVAEAAPGMLESLPSLADTVEEHLITRLAAHLPHLDRAELMLRHDAVLAAIGGLIGSSSLSGPSIAGEGRERSDMLVAWVAGGLRAPSARSAVS